LGGYSPSSAADRGFAFDFDRSGVSNHLFMYRPGSGKVWILRFDAEAQSFASVYDAGAIGHGIGAFDFFSADDRAFAFDYEHSGRADYICVYRGGTGLFQIYKHGALDSDEPAPNVWIQVFPTGDESTDIGIGGYDLRSSADHAFAFDWDHSGKLDHIVLYRPGAGKFAVLKNKDGVFSAVFSTASAATVLKGFDLLAEEDKAMAFDYEHIGKPDYILFSRPGSGKLLILGHREKQFFIAHQADSFGIFEGGIGGYDMMSKEDHIFAYDLEGTGRQEYLVLYRPGSGSFCAMKNTRGVFSPVYMEGDPGAGVAGYDLKSPKDRAFPF
ncbi:hypothetical protein M501DRAFT_923277, partial [Patellaria atrata CBS 101060]